MHPEYRAFFRVLRPVTRYAVDLSPFELDREGEKDKDEDKMKRPIRIVQADFVTHLYRKRVDEVYINRLLHIGEDFICIIGNKGSGKTSMGRVIADTIGRSKGTYVCFLDIRLAHSEKNFEEYKNERFRGLLLRRIRDMYFTELFPPPDSASVSIHKEQKNERELYAYLLEHEPSKPPQIFSDLIDHQSKASLLFRKFKHSDFKHNREKTFGQWLKEQQFSPEVIRLTDSLRASINLKHLVYAAAFLYGYVKQYIWFDNIDTLPIRLQSETVIRLKSLQGGAANFLTTVVAVREENVFRDYEYERTAPPNLTRIKLGIRTDHAGHKIYDDDDSSHPAIGIPVIQEPLLREIVSKRLEFTKQYQLMAIGEINTELQDPDLSDTQKQIIGDQLKDFLPVISNQRFEYLLRLTQITLKALQTHKAIYLSNNSLRDFLMIFRDFLAELLKVPPLFRAEDISEPKKLAQVITDRTSQPHEYLWERMSKNFKDRLRVARKLSYVSNRLAQDIADGLNWLLFGPSLFNELKLAQLLGEEDLRLLKEQSSPPADVPRLNRIVLEKIFLGLLTNEISGSVEELEPAALKLEPREIATRFLMWVRQTRRRFRIGLYDIIENTNQWFTGVRSDIGCNLTHLVITTIWNLTLDTEEREMTGYRRYTNPTLGQVVKRLQVLGFERERIIEAIAGLYRYNEMYNHAVEFRTDTYKHKVSDIKDEDEIYLTQRGKCFVALSCNTFGYIYQCVQEFERSLGSEGKSTADESANYCIFLTEEEKLNGIFPHLCDVATMHCAALVTLRDEVLSNDKHFEPYIKSRDPHWLDLYYRWYGIPRLHPFPIHKGVGKKDFKGTWRVLQFQAIIDGISSYFQDSEAVKSRVTELQKSFDITLNHIAHFRIVDFDFRIKFGISPRSDSIRKV